MHNHVHFRRPDGFFRPGRDSIPPFANNDPRFFRPQTAVIIDPLCCCSYCRTMTRTTTCSILVLYRFVSLPLLQPVALRPTNGLAVSAPRSITQRLRALQCSRFISKSISYTAESFIAGRCSNVAHLMAYSGRRVEASHPCIRERWRLEERYAGFSLFGTAISCR